MKTSHFKKGRSALCMVLTLALSIGIMPMTAFATEATLSDNVMLSNLDVEIDNSSESITLPDDVVLTDSDSEVTLSDDVTPGDLDAKIDMGSEQVPLLEITSRGIDLETGTPTEHGITYCSNYPNTEDNEKDKIFSCEEKKPFTTKDEKMFAAPSEGMRLKEWNTKADGSGETYKINTEYTMPDTNLLLFAIWEPSFNLIINTNAGGTITQGESGSYFEGDTIDIEAIAVDSGYIFDGWKSSNGGKFANDSGEATKFTMPANDVTITATWKPVYNLKIIAGAGGTVVDVSNQYAQGDTINITATADSGYNFSGWTTNNGGEFASTSDANTTFTMPGNHVSITANFTTKGGGGGNGGGGSTKYTVTYTANGGTGKDHKVTGLSSNSKHTVLSLSKTGISNTDDTFDGWNTKADGSGTAYTAKEILIVKKSITLYAQWEKSLSTSDDIPSKNDEILFKSDHIKYLYGYNDDSVKADNPITRAEASAIFYRLLANPGTANGGKFSDVSSNEWYAQSVNYLASIDVVAGYEDGTFKPNQTITRAEFATIASRFDELAPSNGNAFSDVSESHWALKYINSAYEKGWISGYPDGTFRPDNSITRAEVVTVVNAMLNRAIDDEALEGVMNPYNDITRNHWAYADVIEASIAHEYETVDNDEIWLSW